MLVGYNSIQNEKVLSSKNKRVNVSPEFALRCFTYFTFVLILLSNMGKKLPYGTGWPASTDLTEELKTSPCIFCVVYIWICQLDFRSLIYYKFLISYVDIHDVIL